MKQCPTCRRTYTDENLFFCLEDGAALIAAASSAEKTLEFNSPPTEQITVARTSAPPNKFEIRPFANQPAPNQSSGKLWIIPVVGVLLFIVFGGIFGAFFLLRSRPKPLPNTNIQTIDGNASVNSRTVSTPLPSPTIEKPPSAKLIGTWETNVVEQGVKTRITYTMNADGTSKMFFKTANGQTGRDSGTWQFSNGVLYETFSNGVSGKGALKMLDENTFEITIIDNGTPAYTGLKRIYRRK